MLVRKPFTELMIRDVINEVLAHACNPGVINKLGGNKLIVRGRDERKHALAGGGNTLVIFLHTSSLMSHGYCQCSQLITKCVLITGLIRILKGSSY